MIVYQLFVKGESLCGWQIKRYSQKIFLTPEEAEAHWPAFLEAISNPLLFDTLDLSDKNISKEIIKLELVPGNTST